MNRFVFTLSMAVALALGAAPLQLRAVTIETVPVGNAGNAPDTRYNSYSVGSVGYTYQIGKYEVTAGQYTEFLNAVAKSDPNGLYDTRMALDPSIDIWLLGPNIQRSGSSPNYSYSVATDWANRPVTYISFWDAARFANWLHNSQPTGPQGPGTTEDGAYHDVGKQAQFGRNSGARFFIPTENEWYKAAYHKNDGVTGNYWDYPTSSNTLPLNTLPDPGNHANTYQPSYAIGSPYYRTEVGAYVNSASPYGTFDQGGSVWEWTETILATYEAHRIYRGGGFEQGSSELHASRGFSYEPEYPYLSFRIATIPELPGDFNHDGTVDAADYVVWRKTAGSPDDYNAWRANFGRTYFTATGSGATAGGSAFAVANSPSSAIPEPNSVISLLLAITTLHLIPRSRGAAKNR